MAAIALSALAGASSAAVVVDARQVSGRPLPNLSAVLTAWDGSTLNWTHDPDWPITNFVEYVELMTATGGRHARDLFVDPANTNVLDDYDFKPLVRLCRKARDYGILPYLKIGNVPAKFVAGCDPRRKQQGGKDGGSYGFNIRPPDDYEPYFRYLKACAAALKAEFGVADMRRWRYAVLTEANNAGQDGNSGWFSAKGARNADTLAAFLRLYETTLRAFECELGEGLTFGTHLLETDDLPMSFTCRDVVGRCRSLRLLPISYYLGHPDRDRVNAMTAYEWMTNVVGVVDASTVTGIDEGRICFSRPGTRSSDLRTRVVGQSYQAAFDVRLSKAVLDAGGEYIAAWGYFAGEDAAFSGVPTFSYFTGREIAKFAGCLRCEAAVSGERLPVGEVLDVVAAVSPDGHTVRAMVSRLRDKLEFATSRSTRLRVKLPPAFAPGEAATARVLTLDDRNNWFVEWQRDRRQQNIDDSAFWASPDDANPLLSLEREEARAFFKARLPAYRKRAAEVRPVEKTLAVNADGTADVSLDFTGNGAAFLELSARTACEGTWFGTIRGKTR